MHEGLSVFLNNHFSDLLISCLISSVIKELQNATFLENGSSLEFTDRNNNHF